MDIVKLILGLVSLIREFLERLATQEAKQEGRNEAAYDVTRETAEAENRMRDVADPADSDLSKRMQDGSF